MLSFFKSADKNARRTLLTCFFAFFCNGVITLTMGSAMPDLKAAYGLTDTTGGLLLSAYSAGNLAAGFISGVIPLWLGERRSVMLMTMLAVLGYSMTLVWGWPGYLLLAFLLIGLGRGSVTHFTNRTVNRMSGGSPVASNILHSCLAVGAILAPLMFLGLHSVLDWRLGLGFVILCGCLSVWNFGRMKLEQDRPQRGNKAASTWVFMKDPAFLILAMMMFAYMCSEYAINGWLVTYIQSKESLVTALAASGSDPVGYSQTMASLLWFVMLAGRLLCAALSSRLSQKKMMMVSSFGMAAFFLLMLSSASIPMATFSVAGLGLCMAGVCPMIYSDAAVFTNRYPLAMSALLVFGSAGGILMPTVVGALAEVFGFSGGMSAIVVTVTLLVLFSVLNVVYKARKAA